MKIHLQFYQIQYNSQYLFIIVFKQGSPKHLKLIGNYLHTLKIEHYPCWVFNTIVVEKYNIQF